MKDAYKVLNIKQAISSKLLPTVVMWNRLEGRPRTHNFDKALKAEVRDALWMLTKQWQMGELKGDDAGSPVFSKVHISTTKLNKYKAHNQETQKYESHVPLEVKAEQKMIPFIRDNKELSIDIRLQMGLYWLKLLKKNGLDTYIDDFIREYTFTLPIKDKTTDYIYSHKEVWQQYSAISGRCIDGYKLYKFLKENKVADNPNLGIAPGDVVAVNILGEQFVDWFETLYYQPVEEENNAWIPDKLEYQFACSAPLDSIDTNEKTLTAEEYYNGHLDWYAFDISKKTVLGDVTDPEVNKNKFTQTFIPSHVEFEGMPNLRWWKFEDSKTNLGGIKPSTSDLSKLLLMEFGLVFANDWFMIPFALPIGSLAHIEGLMITNNFGERFWIESAGKGSAADWKKWNMFNLNVVSDNGISKDTGIFLAPSAAKVHEGKPIEEICMIRDEIANMVWGVETTIPLPNGFGRRGNETGLEVRQFHERLINNGLFVEPPPYKAKVSYLAMTSVPENWIPFMPVHKKNDNREIQLQRSSMLRIIEGDPAAPLKIKPQTSLLRFGLDTNPKEPYFLFEEEVPRAGVSVNQAFQRTRWTNGEVFVWLGIHKKTGRGEGSSGLVFDQIVNVEPEE
ncbi:MAG: hypothetical protein M3R36_04010 [Bacteroidota bacterium]|nr:hypothetical protein [Bacteroidota bacterium]